MPVWDRPEIERVGFVGDLHGNLTAARRALQWCRVRGAQLVVQVGDLGVYWPGDGDRVTSGLDRVLERAGLSMVFVDGNHDGHERLSQLRGGGPGRVHQVGERLWWADRGARFHLGTVRFGALGGAYSVDAGTRTAGVDWWPDLEEPTARDVARLGTEPLDVLVSHDAPAQVPLVSQWPVGSRPERASWRAREAVSAAVGATGAGLVVHGHWHHRHDTGVDIAGRRVRVLGLAGDIDPVSQVVAVLGADELARSREHAAAGGG